MPLGPVETAFDTSRWLLPAIAEQAMVPAAAAVATDAAAMLRRANTALRTRLLPRILSYRSDHLLPLAPVFLPILVGKADYRLPSRAAGGKVRQVRRLSSTGVEQPIWPASLSEMISGNSQPLLVTGGFGYTLRGNALTLSPIPKATAGDVLRVDFEVRPGVLVDAASVCWQISTLGSANVYTALGPTSALASGSTYDIIHGAPPFELLAVDVTPDSTSAASGGLTFTFTTAAPASLLDFAPAVGDWICPHGMAPVIQLPLEMHDVVATLAACETAKARGDSALAQALAATAAQQMDAIDALFNPRDEGRPGLPIPIAYSDFPG